jgi:hypothetical protein
VPCVCKLQLYKKKAENVLDDLMKTRKGMNR